MRLAEAQALFASLVLGEAQLPPEGLERFVGAGAPAESLRRRLDVYLQSLRSKTADSLRVPFRKVAVLLGEDRFAVMAEAHWTATPEEDRTVEALIRGVPDFLRETAARWGRPDLPDLASLELAHALLAREATEDAVDASALRDLGPDDWPSAALGFVPAMCVLDLEHDVSGLWRSLEGKLEPPPPARAPTSFVCWRKGVTLFHARVDRDEADALRLALQGASLAEICRAFGRQEAPAEAAASALQSWFADGLVASVRPRLARDPGVAAR